MRSALMIGIVVLIVIFGVIIWSRGRLETGDEAQARPSDQLMPEDPEARAWLSRTDVPTSLASNRFDDVADARAFVEELYAAGAEQVVVASENIEDEGTDGLYSDALKVVLPKDEEKRRRVFLICNREAVREGFDAEKDRRQPVLFLWWD